MAMASSLLSCSALVQGPETYRERLRTEMRVEGSPLEQTVTPWGMCRGSLQTAMVVGLTERPEWWWEWAPRSGSFPAKLLGGRVPPRKRARCRFAQDSSQGKQSLKTAALC